MFHESGYVMNPFNESILEWVIFSAVIVIKFLVVLLFSLFFDLDAEGTVATYLACLVIKLLLIAQALEDHICFAIA